MPKSASQKAPATPEQAVRQRDLAALKTHWLGSLYPFQQSNLLRQAVRDGWVEGVRALHVGLGSQEYRQAMNTAAAANQLDCLRELMAFGGTPENCVDALIEATLRKRPVCIHYLALSGHVDMNEVVSAMVDDHLVQADLLAPYLSPLQLRRLTESFQEDELPQVFTRARISADVADLASATPNPPNRPRQRF